MLPAFAFSVPLNKQNFALLLFAIMFVFVSYIQMEVIDSNTINKLMQYEFGISYFLN